MGEAKRFAVLLLVSATSANTEYLYEPHMDTRYDHITHLDEPHHAGAYIPSYHAPHFEKDHNHSIEHPVYPHSEMYHDQHSHHEPAFHYDMDVYHRPHHAEQHTFDDYHEGFHHSPHYSELHTFEEYHEGPYEVHHLDGHNHHLYEHLQEDDITFSDDESDIEHHYDLMFD